MFKVTQRSTSSGVSPTRFYSTLHSHNHYHNKNKLTATATLNTLKKTSSFLTPTSSHCFSSRGHDDDDDADDDADDEFDDDAEGEEFDLDDLKAQLLDGLDGQEREDLLARLEDPNDDLADHDFGDDVEAENVVFYLNKFNLGKYINDLIDATEDDDDSESENWINLRAALEEYEEKYSDGENEEEEEEDFDEGAEDDEWDENDFDEDSDYDPETGLVKPNTAWTTEDPNELSYRTNDPSDKSNLFIDPGGT